MRNKNRNLHGSVLDKSSEALLLIDWINDFAFDDGSALFESALPASQQAATLKNKAASAGVPVIYVNDNFGRWQSDFNAQVEHCLCDKVLGEEIVRRLQPTKQDYFVLKPKHSGFYSTALAILLEHLGASRLILSGVTTDICVLFTANDAYMRDFELAIPADCVAAVTVQQHQFALAQMQRVLKADIGLSSELEFCRR